jgi:precorrin-2 dehydrogenase/sirohydrochlorin ferrochelatase
METFLPLLLNLRGRPCTVIGGGEVAEGKIKQLLEAEARIEVIAPELTARIEAWAAEGAIAVRRRPYTSGDLEGAFVVVAATDEPGVNAAIWEEGRRRRQLVNVVDDPPHCNFIAPSIVRSGDLVVAISTAGRSPASAKRIRRDLEQRFGPEWATLLDWLSALAHAPSEASIAAVLRSGAVEHLRDGDLARARTCFELAVGAPAVHG